MQSSTYGNWVQWVNQMSAACVIPISGPDFISYEIRRKKQLGAVCVISDSQTLCICELE